MHRHPISDRDFEFPQETIEQAVRRGQLLSMEIEFSLRCNFKCPYCYVPHDSQLKNELTTDEIESAVLQAKALGAKKIIVLGGEPTIYPHTLELIRFMREQDLVVEMFTNGSGVTASFAQALFALQVRVVLKMNSFDPALQNQLAGCPDAHGIIHDALSNLKKAGYPSREHFLAVSSIICRQNINELPRMWQWLRDQQIVPYFEIITPQTNASIHDRLYVPPLELEAFFKTIADLDRRHYGRTWDIQPPLVGNKCMRHQFSCLVSSKGEVYPCVGITLAIGNIRQQPLGDILAQSQVLKDLKNYRQTIKGPCSACDQADSCYGCRGAAFQVTGDYLASDPLCWRHRHLKDESIRDGACGPHPPTCGPPADR